MQIEEHSADMNVEPLPTAVAAYEAPTLIPLGSLRAQTQASYVGIGADFAFYS